MDRGTRASTYNSCSGRQEAEHGRFLGEEPAFSTHLNLDRATLGVCLVQTPAVECLGLEISWEYGEDYKKQARVHIVRSPLSVSSKQVWPFIGPGFYTQNVVKTYSNISQGDEDLRN